MDIQFSMNMGVSVYGEKIVIYYTEKRKLREIELTVYQAEILNKWIHVALKGITNNTQDYYGKN